MSDDSSEQNPDNDPIRKLLEFGAKQYGLDPDTVNEQVDTLVGKHTNLTEAATAGAALGETMQRARGQGRLAESHTDRPQPHPVETASDAPSAQIREVVGVDGDFRGIRVIVSDPDAAISPKGDELVISGSGYHITEPVGFSIGAVEPVDDVGDGVSAAFVKPDDQPSDTGTKSDTSTDADTESSTDSTETTTTESADGDTTRSEALFDDLDDE